MKRSGQLLLALLSVLAVANVAARDGSHQHDSHQHDSHQHPAPDSGRYARSVASYTPPDVFLLNREGAEVPLASALDHDGPLALQFIFTTCPGVCPVLSATFQAVRSQLGEDRARVRLVSISIDPEHDTPQRLRDYAERFRAGPRWTFLTGHLDDIVAVQKSFDAYRGNKMRHEPVTFLRGAPDEAWLRLEGFLGAAELAAEIRHWLPPLGDASLGERIYQQGVLPSGEPLPALVAGDVRIAGTEFACVRCHRRSGFGSVEGASWVPPITGTALYQARRPSRAEMFRKLYQEVQPQPFAARIKDPRFRPAYTDASLATVLREGHDPSGRQLDLWMPRYELSDEDMSHLMAYVKSLTGGPDPGVDEQRIHFATILTPGVPTAQRDAMLTVARSYVERKNRDTEGLLARPNHSPWHRNDFEGSYRQWVLHEWRLTGPPESWRSQLSDLYAHQPVFAILGGLGRGDWRGVHAFCEEQRVPCLFPQTELPPQTPGNYSLYLSRGVAGEARALGRFLAEQVEKKPRSLVQVYGDTPMGRAAATAFRQAVVLPVEDVSVEDIREGEPLPDPRGAIYVLWLGNEARDALFPALAEADAIYLSSTFSSESRPSFPQAADLHQRVFLTHPYALPGREVPRIYRVRAWMRSRGIEMTDERVQLNTFFAFSVADHALGHLVESFSRDYFVEEVEHETENALNPGVYPRLSLGPGQRFASKGSYIIARRAGAVGGIEAISPWIVP